MADSEYDVIVLEECDLALKFKKGTKIQKTSQINLSTTLTLAKKDEADPKKVFYIQCFDSRRRALNPNYFAYNLLKDKSMFYNDFDLKQEFDIILQPNSLAPSTPSVNLAS